MNSVNDTDCKHLPCIVPGLCTTIGEVGNVAEVGSPTMVIFQYRYELRIVPRKWPSQYMRWKEQLTLAPTLLKRGIHV